MIYILSVLELFNFEFCSIWIGHDILTINYFFHSYLYIQSNHTKSHKTIFEHDTVSISDENISSLNQYNSVFICIYDISGYKLNIRLKYHYSTIYFLLEASTEFQPMRVSLSIKTSSHWTTGS